MIRFRYRNGFVPGSRIRTKIRVSNGKKTYKYPDTDLVLYSTM
jgi:hypothetical protein